jgi:hypothetical protein
MKKILVSGSAMLAFIVAVFLLAPTAVTYADSDLDKSASPPIAQTLVREGDFAAKLSSALSLGTAEDEVAAESLLGEAGIAPRNGWIADYPMTPDIVIEVRNAVSASADANRLSMTKDEALRKFNEVTAREEMAIKAYTAKNAEAKPADTENPDPAVINNYYVTEGPPVVTYYEPPMDYYYLYAWVPCPFWWSDFWFPGFFVLRDFHRVVFFHNRPVFISNHFNDVRGHHVFRVDPVSRFRGRTFAGIGVANRRGFISTGSRGSERTIFNGTRTRLTPSGAMPSRGGSVPSRVGSVPLRGGSVPLRGGSVPLRGGSVPLRGGSVPLRGGSMPLRGGSMPLRGGSMPLRGGSMERGMRR